jgi:protein ImuB
MSFVCLWNPAWQTAGAALAELGTALLRDAPRVAVETRGVIWADARGLPAPHLAWQLLRRVAETWPDTRAGVASVPVAAEVAARSADSPVRIVEPGHERSFLAPLPLALLTRDTRVLGLLGGVGLSTAGDLARLERAAVEVRFGAGGLTLWRLARGEDPRRIFGPAPPVQPSASLDFVDYEVRDTARLAFTVNALLETVCGSLRSRGERAGSLVLELPLASGETWQKTVGAALPTADRGFWTRRVRSALDGVALPCGATGVALHASAVEPASAVQGDIFDRGFATASAVQAAVARLTEAHGTLLVEPAASAHPLAERRTTWQPVSPTTVAERPASVPETEPCLTLQLLPEPRPVAVKVRSTRGYLLPVRYLDQGRWTTLDTAAGPDRVSGGHWEARSYAREYFRCVTREGRLVWLFRDAVENRWYLHGWWD